MSDRFFYLPFALFTGIGPARFEKLLSYFGSAEKAFYATDVELKKTGIGEALVDRFISFRQTFDMKKTLADFEKKHIEFVTLIDEAYPCLLAQIPHAPYVLFFIGTRNALQKLPTIGVVGTRKMTHYGENVTQMLTRELVERGFVIVSGLAFGVDACAHETAVLSRGTTIAVLGSGVDLCTPSEQRLLYERIISNDGVVVSILPPGMRASPYTFPMRNRVIAGLSLGVLVTEAAADSGSLITASLAASLSRPVFAVPGQITQQLSVGTNSLVHDGAVMVTGVEDILRHAQFMKHDTLLSFQQMRESNAEFPIRPEMTDDEREVIAVLTKGEAYGDEIVRALNKPSSLVGTLLTLMELKGLIKKRGGMYTLQ